MSADYPSLARVSKTMGAPAETSPCLYSWRSLVDSLLYPLLAHSAWANRYTSGWNFGGLAWPRVGLVVYETCVPFPVEHISGLHHERTGRRHIFAWHHARREDRLYQTYRRPRGPITPAS